jgi:hypothetical protein
MRPPGVWGRRGLPKLARRARQTHWQGSGRENQTGDEGTTEGMLWAGRGNSSEESRSRGGAIRARKPRLAPTREEECYGPPPRLGTGLICLDVGRCGELALPSSSEHNLTTVGRNKGNQSTGASSSPRDGAREFLERLLADWTTGTAGVGHRRY